MRVKFGPARAGGSGLGALVVGVAFTLAATMNTWAQEEAASATATALTPIGVLVFTKTTVFRHDSIPAAIAMLEAVGAERAWNVTASEDAAIFSDEGLAPFDVLVFVSTSGDIFDSAQQDALVRYMQAGGGFVGVHSATDTEYAWPYYRLLIGEYFHSHPEQQTATLNVEDTSHPATNGLATQIERFDEWYNFQGNPRDRVNVLMTIDESTYDAGAGAMGDDHPMAWYQYFDGGRSFYTALGHLETNYTSDPFFRAHVTAGIEWAAGRIDTPEINTLRTY